MDELDEAAEYCAYVLVGDPTEPALSDWIQHINSTSDMVPDEQEATYKFRLAFDGGKNASLLATESAKNWIFGKAYERYLSKVRSHRVSSDPTLGEPDEFLLFSFDSAEDIARLWGSTIRYRFYCQSGGGYRSGSFHLLPVRFREELPYAHRILALRWIGDEIAFGASPGPLDVLIPDVKPDRLIEPNLWPHLLRLPMTSKEVECAFHDGESDQGSLDRNAILGVRALVGSLCLPPTRNIAAIPKDSFFHPDRVAIRKAVLQAAGA
jgi:hypothetical protein